MVSYLDPADAQSDNMILGGMFFQEFFGVFNNDYSTDPTTQTAALFVGQNAQWNGTVTNVSLPSGADPFLLPSNVSAQINNMMVTVAATVQTQGPNWVNIENLGDYNYIWGTSCVQSLGSINDAACTASPTFVREDVNDQLLSGSGANGIVAQGGFNSSGRFFVGDVMVGLTNGSDINFANADSFVAERIYNDAWQYGSSVSSGSMSVSQNSSAITSLTSNSTSGWALESGPVADQSFIGGGPMQTPLVFIGQGNY